MFIPLATTTNKQVLKYNGSNCLWELLQQTQIWCMFFSGILSPRSGQLDLKRFTKYLDVRKGKQEAE